MILIPNQKSILQKIAEYKRDYEKEHGKKPDVIWLDPDEREEVKNALKIIAWKHPVHLNGMLMKNEEDKIDS
jgi:hypothetical protein|tara:strand:+ start:442 stop:657 length:216 start_codon:yes stop_codon:yes gene_type:complete